LEFNHFNSSPHDRVAQKAPRLHKNDAEKIVDAIFDCLVSGLARRDRVELRFRFLYYHGSRGQTGL